MRVLIPLTGLLVLLTVALGLLAVFLSEQLFVVPFIISFDIMLALSLATLIVASRYRAPEGTAGIVYRRGFFHEIIRPGQTVYLIPLLERVEMEIDLRRQGTTINRRDIYTADGYPMNAHMEVFYRVDLESLKAMDRNRWAQIHRRHEGSSGAVRPPELFWQGLVQVLARRFLAEAVSTFPFKKLNPNMWTFIDAQIRMELQNILSNWGIVVERVSIQDLRPGRKLEPALQQEKIAQSKAKALRTQLEALLTTLVNNGNGEVSPLDILVTMLAHRAGQPDAHLPPIVLPSPRGNGGDCDELAKLFALLLELRPWDRTDGGKGDSDDRTPWQSKKAS